MKNFRGRRKENSRLTLVPEGAKRFDTKCSLVPTPLGLGPSGQQGLPRRCAWVRTEARKPAHRTQLLGMLLLTPSEPAGFPLRRRVRFGPVLELVAVAERRGYAAPRAPAVPEAQCGARGSGARGRAPHSRGSAGAGATAGALGQRCGCGAKSGRHRAGAP